jgi:transposase
MTTTFVAALRHEEITAPCVFDGPMNGASFLTYIEYFLAPVLRQGDIVVMDNLASHKVKGVKEAIEQAGATVRFSRNSRPRCEKPRHEHLTPSSRPSRMPSTPSPPKNAKITS